MKKFIIAFVTVIALFSSAVAADYVVVRNDEKITIYNITTSSNSTVWISSYDLVDPKVSQLSASGLPEIYWQWINNENGVYDTRLIKAKQDLEEMKANLEDQMEWNKVYKILWAISIIALAVAIAVQRNMILNLKKKEK